jgi:predicted secreted protein
MASRLLRGVGLASAIALIAATAAACGGGHGASASATATSATPAGSASASADPSAPGASSPATATSAAPVTEDQLTALAYAFGKTHATSLKEIGSEDADGVNDEAAKAAAGGATCETFLNASQAYSTAYGSFAEVDRGYDATTTSGQEHLEVSLVSHTSPAAAKHTVEDTRTAAARCPHVTASFDGSTESMNLAPLAQRTVGDDSAAVRIGTAPGGAPALTTLMVAQAGSITVHVFDVSGKHYDPGVTSQVTAGFVTEIRALYPVG